MIQTRRAMLYGFFAFSLISLIVSLVVFAIVSARLNQFDQLSAALVATPSAIPITPTVAPSTSRALWSAADDSNPPQDLVAVYPQSTLWDHQGAASLRFSDVDTDHPGEDRSFEIGFYRYGATWHSNNFITEFWLGDGHGGILSVAGNNQGGGELQIRNPTDTDSIKVNYYTADHPTISTEHGTPLYFQATNGLFSETHQTFMDGISIVSGSGYSGQISNGNWGGDKITVATRIVHDDSFVSIMPVSQPKGNWWVCEIVASQEFTVCSTATDETMNFHWLVIGGS